MDTLRILMLSEFYGKVGGVSSHMEGLSNFMRKRGHEVRIASGRIEDEIESFQPDIIHIHHAFTPTTFKALRIAEKNGIPAVVTNHSIAPLHDMHFWKLLKLAMKHINSANAIIAVSEAARKFISNFTSKDVIVIPNGVDTERFKPDKHEKSEKILLFVGRLSARKGAQFLIPLLHRYLKENEGVLLIIAGKDEKPPLIPLLKLQKSIFGLNGKVRLLGYVPNSMLPKLYNHADLFLMPSLTMESFGITALESLACATPVISTKVGALPEILKCGGVATSLRDFPDVVEGLLSNSEKILEMGKAGRKLVEKEYSWSVVGEKVEDVYLNVLGGG
jgi:glycosyltransferase involved in cell wall biosynthesis